MDGRICGYGTGVIALGPSRGQPRMLQERGIPSLLAGNQNEVRR